MAPFLSFTAEEAWKLAGQSESIFMETFWDFSDTEPALLDKWTRIRGAREFVNKEIEVQRAAGQIGSSLQANVALTVPASTHGELWAALASLGDDLKFVFINSVVNLVDGEQLAAQVTPSTATKCERCWHWRDDVGHDSAHPTLCGRCTSNLYGAGEARSVA